MVEAKKRPCTKVKYFSEYGAEQHMEHILKNNKARNHKKTVKITMAYHCPYCNFWHLTTAEQH